LIVPLVDVSYDYNPIMNKKSYEKYNGEK